ncbi:hypothetical protein GCM10009809_38640 [Isoptericola hypogeus]|uniref:Uncharacterized protein n=1 Tax=Isoptericola hypogeus TaxID=300179 RepID=A0ABN2JUJ9_9MICO
MHVLLCVEADAVTPRDGAGGADDAGADDVGAGRGGAARAAALAAAWRGAAPRCTVEPLVLPAAAPGPSHRPDGGTVPVGVFVPVTSLGLANVSERVPAATALLRERVAEADLVVVHVPVLDGETLHGGPVAAAAEAAAPHAVPVVLLAGRCEVSRREWSGAGLSGVHEVVGEEAVARVARTWAPGWA